MIHTTTLRKLGESTVLAIPPVFLKRLHCRAGDEMELCLMGDRMEIRPKRTKLSLEDRLAKYRKALSLRTPEENAADQAWNAAPAVGREV